MTINLTALPVSVRSAIGGFLATAASLIASKFGLTLIIAFILPIFNDWSCAALIWACSGAMLLHLIIASVICCLIAKSSLFGTIRWVCLALFLLVVYTNPAIVIDNSLAISSNSRGLAPVVVWYHEELPEKAYMLIWILWACSPLIAFISADIGERLKQRRTIQMHQPGNTISNCGHAT